MAKDRICLVCGSKYQYCGHCAEKIILWKTVYCSEECRAIFNECGNFEAGKLSQKDAYEKLISLNIKNKNVRDSVAESVAKIMAYEQQIKKEEEKKTEETPEQNTPVKRPRRRKPRTTEE